MFFILFGKDKRREENRERKGKKVSFSICSIFSNDCVISSGIVTGTESPTPQLLAGGSASLSPAVKTPMTAIFFTRVSYLANVSHDCY